MTRAKFKCQEIANTEWNQRVTLKPVTGGSPENDEFFHTTPGGLIELTIKNPDVKFEVGKNYFVDFYPAE